MQNIVKKNQFVVIPADTDTTEQKYAAWQTLRDSGMTAKQIGEMFGVSGQTICNHTVTHVDLKRSHIGKYNHEQYEARKEYYVPLMLELREKGYSNADIGRLTGFHYLTVLRYIGEQPDEITLACHRIAGAKVRFRNLARKNQPERDENKPIPAVAKILESA